MVLSVGNSEQTPQETVLNVYVIRPVEGLILPSPDKLVVVARKELKLHFGRDFEVPVPPLDLFKTLENFAARKIKGFEVYYQPGLQLKENDEFWEGKVKPELFFWQDIKNGHFPQEITMLPEGWYIGDRRGKPNYQNGQQRYSEDDYMAPLMTALRAAGKIQKHSNVPENSRFGTSPREIEEVILPVFAASSGAKGTVRNRKFIEFNVRGNIAHREWGKTNTWEWFGDPVFQGVARLYGGRSDVGGLARVCCDSVVSSLHYIGFSPVVEFPSKPR